MVKGKKRNKEVELETGLKGRSGRVVVAAILINCTIFLLKLIVWVLTGSHSMFAESIHSVADTINQIILAFGLHKSAKNPNVKHPYGYANMKYISSLISGVAIFCVGTGFSFYHGIQGLSEGLAANNLTSAWNYSSLINPDTNQQVNTLAEAAKYFDVSHISTDIDKSNLTLLCEKLHVEASHGERTDYLTAYLVLGGSFIFEGVTLMMAILSIRKSAKQTSQSFFSYVNSGADPCVNVVLFEDSAAVCGAAVAAICIGLTSYLDSPIPDAIGSLLVGLMLAAVATLVIYTSVPALVGRSIKLDQLDKINQELESDAMIKAIHDVKGIDMGNSMIRYKAEIDFNGRELTRKYLEKEELRKLWDEVKSFHSMDQLNEFMLKHGENIVDIMGDEIDRIEMNLSKKFPKVRHIDLELE